jgi:S1-C subfamily serine protease
MPRRRPFVLALFVVALASCRRTPARLDDIQKMAYGVKPAVVRVSAYATATFRYPPSAIKAVENELHKEGAALDARNLADEKTPLSVAKSDLSVDTGAGGSGSGFIIHPNGLILTSGHVVAPTRDATQLERDLRRNGAIAALVKHFPVEQLRTLYRGEGLDRYIAIVAAAGQVTNIVIVDNVELSNGETLPFHIVRFSPALNERGTDLALIEIGRKRLPVLPLGDSESVRVGDSIWSVGYPAVASSTDEVIGGWLSRDSDLEPTFNPGTITAIKHDVNNTPVLQSNVAIYRGNSGGPAVDRDGEVIGISTWGHSEAEQIKFLVPINVAKELLAAAGVAANVEGDFNRRYRAALDDAQRGRWMDARSELDAAAPLFPKSPDVIRFRNDINRAIDQLPLWMLHPFATSSVVVVAIAVAVFLVVPRRPKIPKELLNATTETMVAPSGRDVNANGKMLGKFTILTGSRAGERLGLGGSGIRIGREGAICEIVLENPKVSRLHAEVVSIDGKVLLIDRNSSNGTYVNDQKIDKRFLKDGDIIYFGGRNAVAVAFHA